MIQIIFDHAGYSIKKHGPKIIQGAYNMRPIDHALIIDLKRDMMSPDGILRPKFRDVDNAIDFAISPTLIDVQNLVSLTTAMGGNSIPRLHYTQKAHESDAKIYLLNGQHRREILKHINAKLLTYYHQHITQMQSAEIERTREQINETGCWLAKIYDFGKPIHTIF